MLDFKQPQAVALVEELAGKVDVVVENFRPGVADRLGIGYERPAAHNPRLVYVSVSGFGQTGPYAGRPAYDVIVQATSGIMEATGDPGGPPTLVGEAISDVVAGLFASWAILVAVHQTQRTGQGQQVDVAMFDTTLSFLVTSMSRYLFTGAPARRVGNRHPLSAPFGVYQAKDGHFALAVLNRKLFAALASAIGQQALGQDETLASDEQRSAREPELRAAIAAWAADHSVEAVVAIIEQAGVPVAPIWHIAQALESPQALARNLLRPVDDERMRGLRLPVQPVRFGGAAASCPTRAPALGEHTEDLLRTLLGLSLEKLAELKAAGVVGHNAQPSGTNDKPSHKE